MLGEIIPVIDSIKVNRTIRKKNEKRNIQIPNEIDRIELKDLSDEYKSIIDMKNRLEDKAKTIVAALTIAITLILNLSKIIENISDKFLFPYIDIVVFILAFLSIAYMLMAGVMCIQVLIKENLVYQVSLTERKDKKCIYENIQLNINQNLIRNNIIYTSYKSIRNSVACLVIIFILAIFPYPNSGGSVETGENDYKNMEIVYDTPAVKWLTENDQKDFPVNVFVERYKLNGDTDIRNIYSKEMKLLVTIELSGERYIVRDIKGDVEEIDK